MGTLLTLALVLSPVVAYGEERVNLIVIYTDDQGWTDLGVQGIRADLRTPHFDALAAKSLLFDRAYVQVALCGPTLG